MESRGQPSLVHQILPDIRGTDLKIPADKQSRSEDDEENDDLGGAQDCLPEHPPLCTRSVQDYAPGLMHSQNGTTYKTGVRYGSDSPAVPKRPTVQKSGQFSNTVDDSTRLSLTSRSTVNRHLGGQPGSFKVMRLLDLDHYQMLWRCGSDQEPRWFSPCRSREKEKIHFIQASRRSSVIRG